VVESQEKQEVKERVSRERGRSIEKKKGNVVTEWSTKSDAIIFTCIVCIAA